MLTLFLSLPPRNAQEHLHILEGELVIPTDELPLYVLYPEGTDAASKWRIQAVPQDAESFLSRKALPGAWRGIRDGALDTLTGIDGCIFVHAAGFIGGESLFSPVSGLSSGS